MCHPIINQIEKTDKAIVAEGFDTLMSIYTCDAVLVVEPGKNVVGKQAIRKAFETLAVYFGNGLRVHQNGLEILESGDTALVLANTVVSAPNYPEVTRKATYVFKKVHGEHWLCSIDNSYGYDIIQVPDQAPC
ncbi:DUF4440 domain-containing protein [Vibrio amylolyticus]|uniref:YybH family protein n=1 Tax=Vibrio amylolyticus TaxID=2847292 RepID=UPI00354AE97E